jgi:hypothetical protein
MYRSRPFNKEDKKMRRLIVVSLAAAVFLTLLTPAGLSQRRRGRGGGMPQYDVATELTLRGSVKKVESHKGKMGWAGTHLVVQSEGETLTIHVGPTQYLAEQGFSFAEGDQIVVTCSKVKFEGIDALVAREIRIGDRLLTLRNQQGTPAWSRSRWRY